MAPDAPALATAPQVGPLPVGRRPDLVIAERTARRAVRSAVVWGYVFGAYVVSSALGYSATYKTQAQRDQLAQTYGSNAGLRALVGQAHQIQTVAGFTAWRSAGVLSVMGGVWGLLAGTRLLRGEEDAGRWEVVLAGHTTRRNAARQAVAGLGAGLAVLWVLPAVITALVGRSSKVDIGVGPALFLALALVANAAVFLAAGALASQLAPTRRQAAGYAGAALGGAFALRMVADSSHGLYWLRWVTPLGWVENLRPLSSPDPWPLIPIVALTVGLAATAVRLAGSRDLGSSTIPDRPDAVARLGLLGGPGLLAVRLARPVLTAWGVAIALTSVMLGLIAKSAGVGLDQSASAVRVVARLGAPGQGAKAYLGIAFLMAAVLLAFVAAGQISALRDEEAEGRLDHLLVAPLSRPSWLLGRVGIAVVALVAGGLLAGVCTWLGASTQHTGIGLVPMLAAGINLVPPAVAVLGAGVLAFGVRPRAASPAAYAVLSWSVLVEFVAGSINASHWLLDTSVLHQMAPAPAVDPNWATDLGLLAFGVVTTAVGVVAFHRRDLASA